MKSLRALALAFALAAIAMLIAGVNPMDGFWALFVGSLGGRQQIAETLVQTVALLFPALGITLAFRAGLFNIGAEGQMIVGALATGALGAYIAGPGFFAVPALLLAGCIAGGAWGAIAGWLRARFHASEIISTLMLNFVALSFANYMIAGPLRTSQSSGETPVLPASSTLPLLIPDTRLSIALLIAVATALALRWMFARTVVGFELRAAGAAPEAARRSGVNMPRMTMLAMTLSGAIAGLGGATLVTGVLHRFNTQISPGYGYTAIAVALVGDLNPLWVCVAALGFGILESGGLAMQALADVPKDAIHIIEGSIVLVLAARRYVAARTQAAPL